LTARTEWIKAAVWVRAAGDFLASKAARNAPQDRQDWVVISGVAVPARRRIKRRKAEKTSKHTVVNIDRQR
jgi:hypothetical protein